LRIKFRKLLNSEVFAAITCFSGSVMGVFGAESMTKGKPGAVEDEHRLKQMLQAGESVRLIAEVLGKTRDCVRMKIARSNIEVVVQPKISTRTTIQIHRPILKI
jgi:hypothetical protein